MKRNTWNFILDGMLLLLFGGLVWTGFLIHYILPPRHGHFRGTELLLWGWDRHDYGKIHFYLAITTLVLITAHLWLHWSWVCGTIRSLLGQGRLKSGRRIIYGVIFLLILAAGIVGSLVWVNTQVENVALENNRREYRKGETSITQIGQRSLQEISQMTDVPISQFVKELNLPLDVDIYERLGRLRRQYGFDMEDIREVIEKHREQ